LQKGATLDNDQEEMALYRAVAEAYAASGLQASLRKELELRTALARRRHVNATELARIHAQLGEKDEAFRWLNKALAEREYRLYASIKTLPAFDGLRSDPRYKEILKKMNLPE
jgi:tetratricopeptide (TPR) repeat protein